MIVASPRGKTKGPASRVPPGGGPKLSLTERVYAALKKDIITGELMPGQAFTENDLAHRYTASRTPVREAAVRLQLPGRRWKIRGFYRGRHRLPSRYCATHPHALLARAVSQMRAQTERIM